MGPIVSVVMSVYNGGRFLPQAVESILGQTYKDFEFIIIDDSSRDDTLSVLNKYAEQDSRIVIVRNEANLGLTKSLNKGIRISKGTFIARQDADDYSHPQRIARQIDFMFQHPDIALLGTSGYLLDETGKVLHNEQVVTGKNRLRKLITKRNQFIHGSVMIRKSCLSKTGLYNEEFRSGQDYDLFLRIAENYAVENLRDSLYYYRISAAAISLTRAREQMMAGEIAKRTSMDRRRGRLNQWSPGTYQRYEEMLDTFLNRRKIESNICLTRGRNSLLTSNMCDARKEFARAFLAFPCPKTLFHLIKFMRSQLTGCRKKNGCAAKGVAS